MQGDGAGVRADYVKVAEWIAREAHAGQVEESTGAPYIDHVQRVVALVDGDDAKAAAWLHDVIEDSPVTAQELRDCGIPDRVVDAVVRLTRVPPHGYGEYIDGIVRSGDRLAIAVKLADLRDHLRPNCPERLRPRYERAMSVMTGGQAI